MVNDQAQLKILLEKSEWTVEEQQWLLNYLTNSEDGELKELMHTYFLDDLDASKGIDPGISQKILNNIHQKIIAGRKQEKTKLARIWTKRIAAACLIGLVTFSAYLLVKNNSKKTVAAVKQGNTPYKNDVAPGGDKAILTLADGSTIVLDDAQNGTLAQQGTTRVIKLNGRLNYNASGTGAREILYNTIATPRGGQYRVELPDGTMVWLNAASSLRFPTAFVGKERKVEIKGEVYFEVAKNKAMPFIVSVNGAEIQVIGTHFNVMAYDDESSLQTTLLEGSVKFSTGNGYTLLAPGQQSQLSKNGRLKVTDDIDIEKVVAWKDGLFDFEGLNLEMIAKQLSRWYDVEIIYERKIDDLFYAEIPRDTKLSDVLKALQLTGKVHFDIDGRKIIVLP